MEKEKKYPNTKFSSSVISEAQNKFQTICGDEKPIKYRFVVEISDLEKWKFDTEEEFHSEYRKDIVSASYSMYSDSNSLDLHFYSNETTITVSSGSRQNIESVFKIFDDNENSSRINDNDGEQTSLSSFELEKKLSSYHITKESLKNIEKFCLFSLPNLTNNSKDIRKKEYSISITDASGEHELARIDEYSGERFSDSTSRMTIKFRVYYHTNDYFYLRVTFDKVEYLANMQIQCTSKNPREVSYGVAQGIVNVLESNKTINHIYHPSINSEGWITALFLPLMIIPVFLYTMNHTKMALASFTAWILLAIYHVFAKKINPYISFDSQLQDRKSNFWRWLIYGLFGAILFSGFFLLLRKELLGI